MTTTAMVPAAMAKSASMMGWVPGWVPVLAVSGLGLPEALAGIPDVRIGETAEEHGMLGQQGITTLYLVLYRSLRASWSGVLWVQIPRCSGKGRCCSSCGLCGYEAQGRGCI